MGPSLLWGYYRKPYRRATMPSPRQMWPSHLLRMINPKQIQPGRQGAGDDTGKGQPARPHRPLTLNDRAILEKGVILHGQLVKVSCEVMRLELPRHEVNHVP